MFDRLKTALRIKPKSPEPFPGQTEDISSWNESDPRRNAETTPPDEEFIDLNCLWAVEFYSPDRVTNLTQGFRNLGWKPEGPDGPLHRDPIAWLHGLPRHPHGGGFMSLGFMVPANSETTPFGDTHRVSLPDCVSYATGRIHHISPSLVGVVICFVFDEEYSASFDRALRQDRQTHTTPVGQGQRIHLPSAQKSAEINKIRSDTSQLAANWLRDNLPGEFASGILNREIPTCELVTLRSAEPFPSREERAGEATRYLSILKLHHDFGAWRSVKHPKLKIQLGPWDDNGLRHHSVIAANEGIRLHDDEHQDNTKSARIRYLDFVVPDLLITLATQNMLEGLHQGIRESRSSAIFQDNSEGISIETLNTISHHLSHCADIYNIASEVAANFAGPGPSSVTFERFELCPTGRTTSLNSLNMILGSAISDSASRLQQAVRSTEDQITQLGSILGAAENIRIQRRISFLTWVLVVLTCVLVILTVVLLSKPFADLLIKDWGPSVITYISQLSPR